MFDAVVLLGALGVVEAVERAHQVAGDAWPVFFRMLCMCTFTVPAESVSALAMFWLSFPMSAWRNTSSSRLERS